MTKDQIIYTKVALYQTGTSCKVPFTKLPFFWDNSSYKSLVFLMEFTSGDFYKVILFAGKHYLSSLAIILLKMWFSFSEYGSRLILVDPSVKFI